MSKAKQKSAEYFSVIGKQNLVDRFIELKRHRDVIEAELKAITDTVINNPEGYQSFQVVQGKRSYVPVDVIKAHVGQEWYENNTITAATRPYIKIKA